MTIANMKTKTKRNVTDEDLNASAMLKKVWGEYKTKHKISEEQIAGKLGFSQSMFNQLKNGHLTWSIQHVLTVSSFFGLPPDYFKVIENLPTSVSQPTQNKESEKEPIDLMDNEDYPAIKRVSLKLSAGISGFGIDYDIEDKTPIVMRREWFESRGYKPNKLLAVVVKGESMQNGLFDGDTVVINTADTSPVDGEVFAVNYEGEMLIKRIVRDAGLWWLSSDNQDQRKFPRKECVGDSCLIVGRIVHKQSERI